MSDVTVTPKRSVMQRLLDGIERAGDKIPHPAMLFLFLCLIVIVLSHILYLFDVKVTYEVAEPPPVEVDVGHEGGTNEPSYQIPPGGEDIEDYEVVTETTAVESLLTGEGIAFIFSSPVANFNGFGVVGVILVAMAGVGVAEEAGLIGALIRKLVRVAPRQLITYIIVLLGVVSSIASDAGYLILIPLGAAAFLSLGRHPLAGLAAAYAGVGAGFGVNLLITPTDGILTEITNEAVALVDPGAQIDLTANLWFSIVSSLFVAFVITVVTQRFIERRLGPYEAPAEPEEAAGGGMPVVDAGEVPEGEARGLRLAFYGLLGSLAFILLLTVPSWGPLRDPETGAVIGDSPFMASLLFLITLVFLVTGLCYGRGAGTIMNGTDAIKAIEKIFAGLAGLILLMLILSQFIAYFNYSNMATVAAVSLADILEQADVGALVLLVGFILVMFLLDIIIPGAIPAWAIFAPVFVPLFLRLGVGPQTVLAAYRVGDSPINVVTPLMAYLPLIVVTAQRYKKDAGIGTIISLMLPFTAALMLTWTLLFVVWFLLGLPLGPGAPVSTG
jgi:aminobenzoyl-glutamate transport protein